jgi:mRNA interferase HigB
MHVISRKTLLDYWQAHPDVKEPLKAWFKEAEHATWISFNDIKGRYRSADILPDDRVVFNIKGNHYRLVAKINYTKGIVYIRFIGTHVEYDRIDAVKI